MPEPLSIVVKPRELIFGGVRAKMSMEERLATNQQESDKARFAYEWHHREKDVMFIRGPRCRGSKSCCRAILCRGSQRPKAISR